MKTRLVLAISFFAISVLNAQYLSRPLGNFNALIAAGDVDVLLVKSDTNQLKIKEFQGIQISEIITELDGGVLKISTKIDTKNKVKAMVELHYNNIYSIYSNSGAKVYTIDTIRHDNFELKSTGNGQIDVPVVTRYMDMSATTGGLIVLSGRAQNGLVNAATNSRISAFNFTFENVMLSANTKGLIKINVLKKVEGSASTGGVINYTGNPSSTLSSSLGGKVSNSVD